MTTTQPTELSTATVNFANLNRHEIDLLAIIAQDMMDRGRQRVDTLLFDTGEKLLESTLDPYAKTTAADITKIF